MNTAILKLATRSPNGVRRWPAPVGCSNGFKFIPARISMWGVPAVYWPAQDQFGEMIRGARLDQNKALIRREIAALIERSAA